MIYQHFISNYYPYYPYIKSVDIRMISDENMQVSVNDRDENVPILIHDKTRSNENE